jgi:hypothetical protein
MTDRRYGPTRPSAAMVTTAIVSLGTAAAVGWAAAVPVGGATASTGTAPAIDPAAVRTAQQIDAARANLQQVRRDLARMLSREDDLPRATLANLSALVAQLPSVQVPQSTAQPPATHAPAPPPVSSRATGVGHFLVRRGERGQSEDARSALTGRGGGEIVEHAGDLGRAARVRREDDDDTGTDGQAVRAQRLVGQSEVACDVPRCPGAVVAPEENRLRLF